jgi:hypothetical protein
MGSHSVKGQSVAGHPLAGHPIADHPYAGRSIHNQYHHKIPAEHHYRHMAGKHIGSLSISEEKEGVFGSLSVGGNGPLKEVHKLNFQKKMFIKYTNNF